MPTVTKREAAQRDLVEHFVYLAEEAGLDVAERFLTDAEASFNEAGAAAQDGRTAAPQAPRPSQRPQVASQRLR